MARKLTAVLKFNNGSQKIWEVGDLPLSLYFAKEPNIDKIKYEIEEFTELTPDNIINKGGFTTVLFIPPEKIEFIFKYSIINLDGSEVGYYEEN